MRIDLPKVSVVTITYGHEKYITETLDGVLMQQYDGPVEFIIANDNSPDATDEVVKKYFLENPAPSNFEIKYTKHETNKGMMPNFIWALEQATGEYIAPCEGDDYWIDPLKLQKQVDFLEENANYIICGYQAQILIGNVLTDKFKPSLAYQHDLISEELIKDSFIVTSTALFRSKFIQNLPVEFNYVPNGDTFLFRYLGQFGNYKYMGNLIDANVYRIHHGGVWSMLNDQKKIINAMKTNYYLGRYFQRIGKTKQAYYNYKLMFKRLVSILRLRYNSFLTLFFKSESNS